VDRWSRKANLAFDGRQGAVIVKLARRENPRAGSRLDRLRK